MNLFLILIFLENKFYLLLSIKFLKKKMKFMGSRFLIYDFLLFFGKISVDVVLLIIDDRFRLVILWDKRTI